MGSRYVVNKFMKAANTHGLDYELVPSTSKLHLPLKLLVSVASGYIYPIISVRSIIACLIIFTYSVAVLFIHLHFT